MFCYHSTRLAPEMYLRGAGAIGILQLLVQSPCLSPLTNHQLDGKRLYGLSTTRSSHLAFDGRNYGLVVFELSSDILKRHNKVVPIDGHLSYLGARGKLPRKIKRTQMRLGSQQFQHAAERYRDRISADSEDTLQLCEEFVVGVIPNFKRCINRIYLLECDYGHPEEDVEEFLALASRLNIEVVEEANLGDITSSEIYKLHRRAA